MRADYHQVSDGVVVSTSCTREDPLYRPLKRVGYVRFPRDLNGAREVLCEEKILRKLIDVKVCSCASVAKRFESRLVTFREEIWDTVRYELEHVRMNNMCGGCGKCRLLHLSLLFDLWGQFSFLLLLKSGRVEFQSMELSTALNDKVEVRTLTFLYEGGDIGA
jgi:hypothetical protein